MLAMTSQPSYVCDPAARRSFSVNGMTLRALADRSGLSLRFLLDVEAGRGNISVRRLADLAGALQTTAADLVSVHTDDPAPRVISLLEHLRLAN